MSAPPPGPGNGPPSQDRPHDAVASALQRLPRTLSGARRRFLAVNGTAFLLTASLSATARELFATRPVGTMPLGVVLCSLQLAVLLLTSWWYDRTLHRHSDPLVGLIRRQAELVSAATPQPAPAEAPGRRR